MTSPIEDLLARARLHHPRYPQAAIDAAAIRLSARATALPGTALPSPPPPNPGRTPQRPPASQSQPPPPDERSAADDLQTLCETVITHTDALADLKEFLAPRALPEPPGARVLGCMLQLCAREESARFWWQYAAGAGDSAASYCLYLHHRALGEHGVADWWQTQHARYTRSVRPGSENPHGEDTVMADAAIHIGDTGTEPQPDPEPQSDPQPDPEDEISTTLRVLRALKPDSSPVPDPVNAVLHYVPAAVAYVDDDLDLPLPDPDFTDRIHALATPHPATPATPDTPQRGHGLEPLPSRRRAHNLAHTTAEGPTVPRRPVTPETRAPAATRPTPSP